MMTSRISYSTFSANTEAVKRDFFSPVAEKLLKKGMDSVFLNKIMTYPEMKFDPKYVKINLITPKQADYSSNYNRYSVKKNINFILDYYDMLVECENRFGVPREIISAILWIETKHGNYLGSNPLLSVFMSAAMTDQPQFIESNRLAMLEEFEGPNEEIQIFEKKLQERSKKRADWAIRELLALEQMDKNPNIDIFSLEGSMFGAFGYTQFLPSSYMKWAVDGDSNNVVDLFNMEDAIFSIGNYLKENGYKIADSSARAAIFHYNNSKDYVDAVMKLASKIQNVHPITVTDSAATSFN